MRDALKRNGFRRRSVPRLAARIGPLGLLVVAIGLSSCRPGPGSPYNLLLITVDTLRYDRLHLAGHDRDTSPAIDRLAAEGLSFRRVYSQAGWTLPSVVTMLTGRYPRDHGVIETDRALASELPTLAELLSERGYDARAFVSHVLLRPGLGLERGFGSYDDSVLAVGAPHKVSTAEPLTDEVLAALREMQEPFFLWVHYFDPHSDYLAHAEWARFGNGRIDRYDQEIAHTDRHVGRLLEALEARELGDRTVVVFTADHGEGGFGEHEGNNHSDVYEEVLRVPLVIKAPGLAPARRSDTAEQIDLLPTIVDLLEIDPPPGLPGRSLLLPPVERPGPERPVFVERDRPKPFVQRAVIRGRYKLSVVTTTTEMEEDDPRWRSGVVPGVYLFDLETDPAEKNNLYRESHPIATELLALLTEHFAAPAREAPVLAVDEALREKLRSLGYLE